MKDSYVRKVGETGDIDGRIITVGVDYDSVSISFASFEVRLNRDQSEEFASLFVRACWEASAPGGTA